MDSAMVAPPFFIHAAYDTTVVIPKEGIEGIKNYFAIVIGVAFGWIGVK
jgi:hypothetical protein